MITKLVLNNFKKFGRQEFEFTMFDLIIGRNNSGKSTVLQALAIWQFCLDEFHRVNRSGSRGIQIVLPNFTALPVPEFNLLWKDRTDRQWPEKEGKKKQEYILIKIQVEWRSKTGSPHKFGVDLRYQSPQAIFAIPSEGWQAFREHEVGALLPLIAYVPPFSGLEPSEEWRDDGPLRKQVGKAQPGSVLRNLLLRVYEESALKSNEGASNAWKELTTVIRDWFSVDLIDPRYQRGKDTQITVEYRSHESARRYDIISGGSGFHQTLTLLAFYYGFHPTTMLLDEPDAHLHVNLQRQILDFFKEKSKELGTQFLIATHAEEFAKGVDTGQILSLVRQNPHRVNSTATVLRAMSDVSNEEIAWLLTSPYILYVEGETDERIIRAWAEKCNSEEIIRKIYFKSMSGGSKESMNKFADEHYTAARQIVPELKRIVLFDYDQDVGVFHPEPNNPVLYEWSRKHIENYLLVPEVWKRAVSHKFGIDVEDLFNREKIVDTHKIIDDFFLSQNLTLPPNQKWKSVNAEIFKVVSGKELLFEREDSLFQRVKTAKYPCILPREEVAAKMNSTEIHEDVLGFFLKLATFANA